ncbi:hypothetical protein HB364_13520 [Pseudoflavitalea sp. X16]|uniref:hypothetical protein n=1 Tax=Paraflavitalea devenefica TaxID=2716334 RepID=UPI0014242CAB|nr:hypothetical protein [Paraflavitalea devenefica]NII26108.1 hypothetical protein [Paraflavitalea devenefica]
MKETVIKRFEQVFQVGDTPLSFSFHPINIKSKQLYQVYFKQKGTETRFHLQWNGKEFVITDPDRIPDEVRALTKDFNQAILAT